VVVGDRAAPGRTEGETPAARGDAEGHRRLRFLRSRWAWILAATALVLVVTFCVLTTVLFGFEHNLWLAGMMAGAAYNLILYYTKSISQCITAHAVTNLCLGSYVLYTGRWQFW